MDISAIGAIGGNSPLANQQIAQANNSANPGFSVSEMPASATAQASPVSPNSGPGFVDTVLDSVFTEIDRLGSQVPAIEGEDSVVSSMKNDMASQGESTNPTQSTGLKDEKHEAVIALSKTFDHAIFMAMVNQVVSGVSDTSRTLIRQT